MSRLLEIEKEFLADGGSFVDEKIGNLFIVKSNPQLNKDSFSFSEDGEYPYFTRTTLSNGIAGYVKYLDEEHKIKGNCLAVGMLGMQFFYMEKDFYAGQFTKSVFPKIEKFSRFNSKIALYFTSVLNRFQEKFQASLVRNFETELSNCTINLPFQNGKICLNYMERVIQELQAERLQELQAYLQATGLSDYVLSKQEKSALDLLENVNAQRWG